jgi:hypothetical protein
MVALAVLVSGNGWLCSQAAAASPAKSSGNSVAASSLKKIAAIKSFRIIQEKDGPAVEILSTKPLVPAIQKLGNPDRLVIDLPNARLDTPEQRVSVQRDQIADLHAHQLQKNPPMARLVVDLLAPRAYTWDAVGNVLVVHLGQSPGQNPNDPGSSAFRAPAVPSLMPTSQPVVTAVRAAGPLALVGNNAGSGSSFTAGADTAILTLSSGGEVHVCPGTTVAVTPSQNRHNLMLSMNTGALEAHYALDASSDSVMTPDFRILLVGPGDFHYAVSADSQGNTCVRALPGNTASAIVTELLGDRTYQVKATDQLVFRSGRLDRVDMAVPLECGCPPPREAPLRAVNHLPEQSDGRNHGVGNGGPAANANRASAALPVNEESAPNELHVQADVPLVFRASGPPPVPLEVLRDLPVDSRPRTTFAPVAPLPPLVEGGPTPAISATASANDRGFLRRIAGFFAALFH